MVCFVFMTFAVPLPWGSHSHPSKRKGIIASPVNMSCFGKGLVGFGVEEIFSGERKRLLLRPTPTTVFHFWLCWDDGIGSKPQQAATSNCQRSLKQGNDCIMPRHCLWWLKFQLLLHLALSPVMKEDLDFFLVLLKLASCTSGGHLSPHTCYIVPSDCF